MATHNPAHGRQPDTGARKFRLRVQTLECDEQFFCVGHVKAGTVVPDKKYRYSRSIEILSHTDARIELFGSEFPGVAQQVFHQRAYKTHVPASLQPALNFDVDLAFRLALAPFIQNVLGHDRQVYALVVKLHAGDLRQ